MLGIFGGWHRLASGALYQPQEVIWWGASGGVYTIIAIGLFQFWRQAGAVVVAALCCGGAAPLLLFCRLSPPFSSFSGSWTGATMPRTRPISGGCSWGGSTRAYLAHRPALTDISFWAKTTRQEPPWERKRAAVQARRRRTLQGDVAPRPSKKTSRAEVDRILDKITKKKSRASCPHRRREKRTPSTAPRRICAEWKRLIVSKLAAGGCTPSLGATTILGAARGRAVWQGFSASVRAFMSMRDAKVIRLACLIPLIAFF